MKVGGTWTPWAGPGYSVPARKEGATPGVWAGGARSTCCRVRVAGGEQARKARGWLQQQEPGIRSGLQRCQSWPSSHSGTAHRTWGQLVLVFLLEEMRTCSGGHLGNWWLCGPPAVLMLLCLQMGLLFCVWGCVCNGLYCTSTTSGRDSSLLGTCSCLPWEHE